MCLVNSQLKTNMHTVCIAGHFFPMPKESTVVAFLPGLLQQLGNILQLAQAHVVRCCKMLLGLLQHVAKHDIALKTRL